MIKVTTKHLVKPTIFILIIYSNIYSQNLNEVYPKADVHLGISLTKGSYVGTIFQISNNVSFEASFGGGIGFTLFNYQIMSLGANYHFRYFILNISYIHFEEINKYFSHMVSANIELFYINDPGFHLIGAVGGFYEIGKYYSDEPKEVGVNFNLALGFTIL